MSQQSMATTEYLWQHVAAEYVATACCHRSAELWCYLVYCNVCGAICYTAMSVAQEKKKTQEMSLRTIKAPARESCGHPLHGSLVGSLVATPLLLWESCGHPPVLAGTALMALMALMAHSHASVLLAAMALPIHPSLLPSAQVTPAPPCHITHAIGSTPWPCNGACGGACGGDTYAGSMLGARAKGAPSPVYCF